MLCFGSCCLAKITPRHADYCLRGAGVPPPCLRRRVCAAVRAVRCAGCRCLPYPSAPRLPPCLRRRSGRPVRRMSPFAVSVRAVSVRAVSAAVSARRRLVRRMPPFASHSPGCPSRRGMRAFSGRGFFRAGLFPDGSFSGRGCFRAGRLRSRRRARGGLPSPQDQLHGAGHFAARGKLDAKHPFTGNRLPVPGGGGPAWRLGHRFEDASFEAVVGRLELG